MNKVPDAYNHYESRDACTLTGTILCSAKNIGYHRVQIRYGIVTYVCMLRKCSRME